MNISISRFPGMKFCLWPLGIILRSNADIVKRPSCTWSGRAIAWLRPLRGVLAFAQRCSSAFLNCVAEHKGWKSANSLQHVMCFLQKGVFLTHVLCISVYSKEKRRCCWCPRSTPESYNNSESDIEGGSSTNALVTCSLSANQKNERKRNKYVLKHEKGQKEGS